MTLQFHLDELVQNYLSYLKEVKHAPYQTFRAYQVDLIQFLKYFLRLEINEIPSKDQISEYVAEIRNKYNYSSFRRKITVLRNFISYLVESGINAPDPLISLSLPMPKVDFDLPITYKDALNFIDSLPQNKFQELRDKLIFSLIVKCGLTVKQLLGLKIKDFNLASAQIIVSSNQIVFFDPDIVSLVEQYFSLLKEDQTMSLEDYFFVNHLKKSKLPLSTRTINLIVDKISKEKGFRSRLSPTILRRLFAKSLSENNMNKQSRELLLGKKSTLLG